MGNKVKIRLSLIVALAILTNVAIAIPIKKDQDTTLKRVLILGNSITRHGPAPGIGWYGDWGMAASSKDKDFVHILKRKFQAVDNRIHVDFSNLSLFERTYWRYDLSRLDSLQSLHPDLIILRIGENVDSKLLEKYDFEAYYQSLIDYFRDDNASAKILCVSSFWKKDEVDTLIEHASKTEGCHYLKISQLSADPQNMALGKFKNKGVARHPSDRGMNAIAGLIWMQVQLLMK